MKKILTAFGLFAAFSASAQLLFRAEKTPFSGVITSQNSLAERPNIFYLELSVGTTKSANDVEIFTGVVDIGDLKGWLLADSSGAKSLKFNSPIDVFNYLHEQGWEAAAHVPVLSLVPGVAGIVCRQLRSIGGHLWAYFPGAGVDRVFPAIGRPADG